MTPTEAERIAFAAHAACGQYRADGVTPYIAHPRRVAELARAFSEAEPSTVDDRMVAAYLHDVIEDTKLSGEDLTTLGVTAHQLDIVERLTKEYPNDPATPEYYQRIAESEDALVVKCADRCANLEDALTMLRAPRPISPRRWERYAEKTLRNVLPMYAEHPQLHAELESRLTAIARELPAALERREHR
jgi:(p)ppGpp synthase/HD superfamily hydrolase